MISPDLLLQQILQKLKKIDQNDIKTAMTITANLCLKDKELCKSIYLLSSAVFVTARRILKGEKIGGGEQGEEEQ